MIMRRFLAGAVVLIVSLASTLVTTTAAQAAYPTCDTTMGWYLASSDPGGKVNFPTYSGVPTPICVMARGAHSWGVVVLQDALKTCNGAGSDFPIDGIYGARTEDVVRWLQAVNGIAADGVYGPNTKHVINWPVHHGTKWHCHRE